MMIISDGSSLNIFKGLAPMTGSTHHVFLPDTNRAADADNADPLIRDHAADCAFGDLPSLGKLTDGPEPPAVFIVFIHITLPCFDLCLQFEAAATA